MVKLLVVDDEITSRESLIRNITKMDLNISFIEQSDDGINALETAAWYQPDIVLTDVRMPRMDGIEMAYKLRESLPDTKIIFMSGYSDKEYLKSAIHLRALSYIEKPIDYGELKNAINDAVQLLIDDLKNRKNAVTNEKLARNFSLLRNELAINLISPYKLSKEEFDYTLMGIQPGWNYLTILIQIIAKDSLTPFGFYSSMENAIASISGILTSNGLTGVSAIKDNEYILIHIGCPPDKKPLLTKEHIALYLKNLEAVLQNIDFFVGVGKQVTGIANVPQSYATAVLSLQKGFFTGYKTILFYSESSHTPYIFSEAVLQDMKEWILKDGMDKVLTYIKKMALELRKHTNTLPNNIKEYFYRIIVQLNDLADELGLETYVERGSRNQLLQSLSSFHTLNEVEDFCIRKLQFFFQCRKEKRDSKSKILQIKRFIEQNYTNNELSVKMISEHNFLSLAYMCSIFKQETGDTINQYITDYRMEKARDLLKQKSCTISEVAESIGIGDSQYFAKVFKKRTGFTPSEYKEMHLNEE